MYRYNAHLFDMDLRSKATLADWLAPLMAADHVVVVRRYDEDGDGKPSVSYGLHAIQAIVPGRSGWTFRSITLGLVNREHVIYTAVEALLGEDLGWALTPGADIGTALHQGAELREYIERQVVSIELKSRNDLNDRLQVFSRPAVQA